MDTRGTGISILLGTGMGTQFPLLGSQGRGSQSPLLRGTGMGRGFPIRASPCYHPQTKTGPMSFPYHRNEVLKVMQIKNFGRNSYNYVRKETMEVQNEMIVNFNMLSTKCTKKATKTKKITGHISYYWLFVNFS